MAFLWRQLTPWLPLNLSTVEILEIMSLVMWFLIAGLIMLRVLGSEVSYTHEANFCADTLAGLPLQQVNLVVFSHFPSCLEQPIYDDCVGKKFPRTRFKF